jgi:hypothetical protein
VSKSPVEGPSLWAYWPRLSSSCKRPFNNRLGPCRVSISRNEATAHHAKNASGGKDFWFDEMALAPPRGASPPHRYLIWGETLGMEKG